MRKVLKIVLIMKKIVVFASGSGSNAEKIAEYFAGKNQVVIAKIFCNNSAAGVIQRAERLGIPLRLFSREEYKSEVILNELKELNPDLIVLAGFLWLIPAKFVENFPNKIINIHPALLPNYGGKGMYGHFVHEAVIKNKEEKSGITIHFVDEHYDEGAIIHQASYSIEASDTPDSIALKGQKLEHEWFPRVVEELLFKN